MRDLQVLIGGDGDPSGRRGRLLAARADAGELIRLAPGRFVEATAWRRAGAGDRHAARVEALSSRIADRLVVSHASAASLHGLPWAGEFPDVVDVIDPDRARAQSLRGIRKHAGARRRLRTVRTRYGRAVTDLVSTAVDLAVTLELRRSVPALDRVLAKGKSRAELVVELESRTSVHGMHRARAALEFADPLSGSTGESVARVALDESGAPAPVLQHEFRRGPMFIGRVDFWFPDQGAVLEFDGASKYRDPSMRAAGMSAADVVVNEKRREDAIRGLPEVTAFGRFGWAEAHDPAALRAVLVSVGLPLAQRRFRTLR